MNMNALQVTEYLCWCVYRPEIFPKEVDAVECTSQLRGLYNNGVIKSFNHTSYKPTLSSSFLFDVTPPGAAYWRDLHMKLNVKGVYLRRVPQWIIDLPDNPDLVNAFAKGGGVGEMKAPQADERPIL